MRVLVTRPEGEAAAAAAALGARGHEAVISPALELRLLEPPLPVEPFQGVVVTSANGARAAATLAGLERIRDLPLFAIGEATAEAARAAGFKRVRAGSGDTADLVARIRKSVRRKDPTLLYLAGRDRKPHLEAALAEAGMRVRVLVVYAMEPAPYLADAAAAALHNHEIDAVLHFSRRSAEAFLAAASASGLRDAALETPHVAISADAAEPLAEAGASAVAIAATPTLEAMLERLGEGTEWKQRPFSGYAPELAEYEARSAGEERSMSLSGRRTPDDVGEGVSPPEPDVQPSPESAQRDETSSEPIPSAFALPAGREHAPGQLARQRPGRAGSAALGGLAGLIGGGIAALAYAFAVGLEPFARDEPPVASDPAVPGLAERVTALEQRGNAEGRLVELRERVAGLEQRPDRAPELVREIEVLRERLGLAEAGFQDARAALEARLDEFGQRVAGLGQRLAGLDELARRVDALEGLAPRVEEMSGRLGGLSGRVDEIGNRLAEVEGLRERVAAVEQNSRSIAAIEQRLETELVDRSALRAVALAGLQNALARGAPFESELRIAEELLGPEGARLQALEPYSQLGIPTIATLRQEFAQAADRIAGAESLAGARGPVDRLIANARSLVDIQTPAGTGGSRVSASVDQIGAALQAGDLLSALNAWEALPEPARAASAQWAERLRARLAAETVLSELSNAVTPTAPVQRQQ